MEKSKDGDYCLRSRDKVYSGSNETHKSRTVIRKYSQITEHVRGSLQCCKLFDNLGILNDFINSPSSKISTHKLKGLRAVLEVLITKLIRQDGLEYLKSCMPLQEAYEQYAGYIPEFTSVTTQGLSDFKELLCHPKYGLCVLIIHNPHTDNSFVCLRPDDIDIANLVEVIFRDTKQSSEKFQINYESLQMLLQSMDTEYDKQVAKILICANRSRSQISALGIDPDSIPSLTNHIQLVAGEVENVQQAATDIVRLRLIEQESHLTQVIDKKRKAVEMNTNTWPVTALDKVKDDIQNAKERLETTQSLLDPVSTAHKNAIKQRKRRVAEQLMEDHRLKRRKLTSQGAPQLIDTDDEEFIAKCIEDKATYHGRRHNLVMYTNRRVKNQDLKAIANFHLQSRKKKLIKSSTTAYNRCKPKNIRSKQAKQHVGKGLFCCKKPPKAEDCDNENTHYQRAHVKNVKFAFFGKNSDANHDFCFMESTDDKAYIRPGTSEGFSNARSGKIFTLTDEERARKLPKYDWPEKLVYQTPAAHRIFTKESVMEGEEEKLVTKEDHHIVFVRPKELIPSNGSTYKSETVRMRHEMVDIFEVNHTTCSTTKYSTLFRTSCAITHDAAFLYHMMTMPEDLQKVTNVINCKHANYEKQRVAHLNLYLDKAVMSAAQIENPGEKDIFSNHLVPRIQDILLHTQEVEVGVSINDFDCEHILGLCTELQRKCSELLNVIEELNLQPVKPRCADFTDAGPGQGVSNFDVRFRDAEVAIMFNSDYRIRVHRSRGDSGQGEAERTNSAIQDSIVDGGTIHWEKHKRFADMTEVEIETMSLEDYENHEKNRMKKNAWEITRELTRRIDGAPVLSSYIKAYESQPKEELFFFNGDNLKEYQSSGTHTQKNVPGGSYIKKILDFITCHYSIGELYMEYLKKDCILQNGELCWHCENHNWVGPPASRIPQPVPDRNRPGHFLQLKDCPKTNVSGEERLPDDFQPRANIKKLFKYGDIDISDETSVNEFALKFCVKKEYVVKYVQHLHNLKTVQSIREESRKQNKQEQIDKDVFQYDWTNLVESGNLKKLLVKELDKYLIHHQLERRGKKNDKVKAIMCHVLQMRPDVQLEQNVEEIESSSDEEILAMHENDDVSDSDASDPEVDSELLPITVQTRSGRRAGAFAALQFC